MGLTDGLKSTNVKLKKPTLKKMKVSRLKY